MAEGRPKKAVSVCLHGVTLELTAAYSPFLDYVGMAMEPFVTAAVEEPQIHAHLDWAEGGPSDSLRDAFGVERWDRRPDRDLYVAGSDAYWLRIDDFRDLQLSASWNGGLRLTGRYHFSLGGGLSGALRRLRWAASLQGLRSGRFSTLLYYLVYYPILWWLSRYRSFHTLHAAAVARGGKAAVLGGMPGCGKSTLAVRLLADPSYRMLSDNLVLHDSSRVCACPELLLLDKPSLEMVGPAAAHLRTTGDRRVFSRDAFRTDAVAMEPLIPAAFFLVERGRETLCEPLASGEAARRLSAGNTMAKEVRRLAIMSEVLDLVAQPPVVDAKADLAALLSEVPAYALRIRGGDDLGAIVRRYVDPVFSDHDEGA